MKRILRSAAIIIICVLLFLLLSHFSLAEPPIEFSDAQLISQPVHYGPKPEELKLKPKPRKHSVTSPNRFYPGNCTWYVASKMNITFSGDAKYWMENAEKAGYTVSQIPAAGAAIELRSGNINGHVAYVESIENNQVKISAMNELGLGVVNTRTISLDDPSILGFIYPNE